MKTENQIPVKYYSLKFDKWLDGVLKTVRETRKGNIYVIETKSTNPFWKIIERTADTIQFIN